MNCSILGSPVLHCSDSCPLSWWCYLTISSSATHFSSCLLSFPSIRVFSNELALCIRWPKYWRFSFSSSPSKEYSRLIPFRIDWFDLFAVQGTLKSLLQHNSKAPILGRSAFLMVQLSYLYMTTGKTIPLTYAELCWKSDYLCFFICCLGFS